MRQNTLIITITLIGLFLISLIVGYFAGERFFKPQASRPPDGVTRPETAPPTMQPSPAAAPTGGVAATPPAASTTVPASPRPTAAPATPPPTPEPAATPARATPTPAAPASVATPGQLILYKVQVGAFATRENAAERMAALKRDGFDPYVVRERGLFLVRVGAFRNRATAVELADRVRARGYEVVIVE